MTFSNAFFFHHYFFDGSRLERWLFVEYLGIHLSLTLNFDYCTNVIIRKALEVKDFIKRIIKMFSSVVFAYTLFCPSQPYSGIRGSCLASYLANSVLRLERVQNKCLSRIALLFSI